MDLKNYIGFLLNEVKPVLDTSGMHYEVIETFDTKHTIVGQECRIVNIRTDAENKVHIYVAYF